MPETATTYAEKQLVPLGYEVKERGKNWLILSHCDYNDIRFLECVGCPDPPEYRKLGCPLHHDGPGGSWSITRAEEFVAKQRLLEKRERVGALRRSGEEDVSPLIAQLRTACPHDVVAECKELDGATICVFCGIEDVMLPNHRQLRTFRVDESTFKEFAGDLPLLTTVEMPSELVNAVD
jgi:hypothetical protein